MVVAKNWAEDEGVGGGFRASRRTARRHPHVPYHPRCKAAIRVRAAVTSQVMIQARRLNLARDIGGHDEHSGADHRAHHQGGGIHQAETFDQAVIPD